MSPGVCYRPPMSSRHVIVVGGGAAGFFAAIAGAEASPGARVTVLERGARFLDKVRISGGGRCNVTNACPDPREFAAHYPRGEQALLGPFRRFSAADTVEWFAARGVRLKAESDGRMFPVTDSSRTIVDCLVNAAQAAGVELRLNCGVDSVVRRADGRFEVRLAEAHPPPELRSSRREEALVDCRLPIADCRLNSQSLLTSAAAICDRLLLATGGCRAAAAGQLAVSLGHTLEPPVPSLFTFQIRSPWLRSLAGVSVARTELSVPAARLREEGPLLVTHQGLSGPAALRLSAWGARALHEMNYQFRLRVNWLPDLNAEQISAALASRRSQPARQIVSLPIAPLPARLWVQLVQAAGIARDTRWAAFSRAQAHALVQQLTRSEFDVAGKSLNREEFVTCGGVRLSEVNFKTMESRVCPGLFFAGELLDIDGVTGGFNFQAAWTTGFIAGRAMAD
jgi:predicted flavoprotein YhiN